MMQTVHTHNIDLQITIRNVQAANFHEAEAVALAAVPTTIMDGLGDYSVRAYREANKSFTVVIR